SYTPAFNSFLSQKSFHTEKSMIFTFIMSYFSLKISEKSRFRKWKLNRGLKSDTRKNSLEKQTR
ncbi:MAG: hypothetical protein IJH67_08950, partial [Thermoguttaceae bacterium]|nr:hypothetical protein [Thermoguttaceae bacterium]